jgi:hypothetical protein
MCSATRPSSLSSTSTLDIPTYLPKQVTPVLTRRENSPNPISTSSLPSPTDPSPSPIPILSSSLPPPYPGSGTAADPYLIDWLPYEPTNPYNWSNVRRWLYTLVIAVSCLCIAFVSTSYSAAVSDIIAVYPGTSQETGIAGISLYVLGEFRDDLLVRG